MDRFYDQKLAGRTPGDIVTLNRQEENHLFRVLRAVPGQHVGLLDGKGTVGQAIVETGRTLRLEKLDTLQFQGRRIHLYVATPRRQKMDAILKSATELGVYRIVPMICQFSVAIPDGDSVERQNDLMLEACKQSGNPFLPLLDSPAIFKDAVLDAQNVCQWSFFGSPYVDRSLPLSKETDIAFFVGPEGGFSEHELALMADSYFSPMKIGYHILRVETAAIAAVAKLL